MKAYPTIPTISEAPVELFEQGHLWLYELVAGVRFRFQLTEYGTLRIGDGTRLYDGDDVPLSHRHAVRHVRERLDREALRTAVEDVEDVVFFGYATIQRGVPYEWDRLPSFLGFDIWHAGRERFLSPDVVESVYRRLGLSPLDTVAREVNVRDFDPTDDVFPASEWYDGPVAGILLKNKRGGYARRDNPAAKTAQPLDSSDSPTVLARRLATERRLSRVVSSLEAEEKAVAFDAVYERLFETIVREEYRWLFADAHRVDVDQFRAALADAVGEFLAE